MNFVIALVDNLVKFDLGALRQLTIEQMMVVVFLIRFAAFLCSVSRLNVEFAELVNVDEVAVLVHGGAIVVDDLAACSVDGAEEDLRLQLGQVASILIMRYFSKQINFDQVL